LFRSDCIMNIFFKYYSMLKILDLDVYSGKMLPQINVQSILVSVYTCHLTAICIKSFAKV
jgi:hypothetical protein